MTSIELTDAQRQAVRGGPGNGVDVVDPVTGELYVLLAREQYEHLRSLAERRATPGPEKIGSRLPPGMLGSQRAYWRDLPGLLQDERNRGQWVCYHGDERIGIGTYEALIRECVRRDIPDTDYALAVIEPRALPLWEPEEVEPGGHEVEETGRSDPLSPAGNPA